MSLVLTIASLQNSIPVQAIVARRISCGWTCRPTSASSSASVVGALGVDVEDHELLLGGQPDPPGAELLGQVGQPPEGRRR